MDAIYDTYDELCKTATEFASKVEIAEKAVAALEEAENILRIAESEEVWKGE